jgi:hypothetical protein
MESPSGAFSTCLGVTRVSIGEDGYELYLNLGTGIAIGDFYSFQVLNYYPFYPPAPNLATTGYDYETTKAHLLGATVNMTITPKVDENGNALGPTNFVVTEVTKIELPPKAAVQTGFLDD